MVIKKAVRIKTNLNSNNIFIENMAPVFSKEKNDDIKTSNRSAWPKFAGIFLILTAISALVFLLPMIAVDTATIQSLIDAGLLPATNTAEYYREFYSICGVIGCVLAVFPLLGGVLALKKKKWIMTLLCGFIGLLFFPLILPGILAVIAIIMIYLSKQEFIS